MRTSTPSGSPRDRVDENELTLDSEDDKPLALEAVANRARARYGHNALEHHSPHNAREPSGVTVARWSSKAAVLCKIEAMGRPRLCHAN